jgi:hypothetical protein
MNPLRSHLIVFRDFQEGMMALPDFTQPGMSSAFPRPTNHTGSSSEHSDLKAMARGIQAWFDDAGAFPALVPAPATLSADEKTAKQPPRSK